MSDPSLKKTKKSDSPSIIMVDDDESVLKVFGNYFTKKGYRFISATTPRDFLKRFKSNKPDIILIDIVIGEMRGDNLIKAFRKCGMKTPVFVISAHLNKNLILDLRQYSVNGFFSKPVALESLEEKIQESLRAPVQNNNQETESVKKPGKIWPPLSVLLMTENDNITDHPDLLIPAPIIEKFNLRIFARSGFNESVTVIKNPDRNIKLLIIDAVRENSIVGMLQLLKIIENNTKLPVFFFSESFSQNFKNSLIKFGFVNHFARASVQTKDVTQKYEDALNGNGNVASKDSALRIQNIMKQITMIKSLPPMPDIYLKIEKLSHNTNATSKDFAEILELDPGITARLLRMSNSAFYSFNRKIKSVKDTVTLMGTREILSLVRLACITNNLKSKPEVETAVKKVWEHSAACAVSAKLLYEKTDLCETPNLTEELFICGIIHDIGQIVMWNHFPEIYLSFMLNPGVSDHPSVTEEEQYMGASHADVGRSLADHWNLPEQLRDAIAFHHKPSVRPDSEIVRMIHFSDIIADMVTGRIPEGQKPLFSKPMLEKTGYTTERFEELAATIAPKIKDDIAIVTKMITG